METEKQTEIIYPIVKAANGGAREGAGRPKGSLNKLSGGELLEALENALGHSYPVQLALNFQQALYGEDKHLVYKYHQLIMSKVIADKIDITSDGAALAPATIIFTPTELPDWSKTPR